MKMPRNSGRQVLTRGPVPLSVKRTKYAGTSAFDPLPAHSPDAGPARAVVLSLNDQSFISRDAISMRARNYPQQGKREGPVLRSLPTVPTSREGRCLKQANHHSSKTPHTYAASNFQSRLLKLALPAIPGFWKSLHVTERPFMTVHALFRSLQ